MINIKDSEECKAACEALKIPIDKLVNGRICFRAGNKKCRQQNTAGAQTSRICKKAGKLLSKIHGIDTTLLYVAIQSYIVYTYKEMMKIQKKVQATLRE